MKKRKSKKKSQKNYSAFGALDYIIYMLAFIVSFIIAVSPLLLIDYLQKAIAFCDTRVIAADTNNASLLFAFPFFFSFFLLIIIPVIVLLGKECPIVGKMKTWRENKSFKNDFIPLLKWFIEDIKSYLKKKNRLIICCSLLLLFLCLTPLSIFTRTTINDDFSITKYNLFNQKVKSYAIEEYENLIIDVYSTRGKGGTTYGYAIEIIFDNGDSAYINNYQFKNIDAKPDYSLDKMLEIKSMFSTESIKIKEYDKLDKVIRELDLNDSQTEKLYELFSTP